MKIKKVELRNINSLAGDWCIDFESNDFANSSMYCISGPTGSGKTSILDAICLALYGLTPRQEKINISTNEVMTYGTLECSAKVFFECQGVVYSACWSQHRAPRSRKLQGYSWSLYNEDEQRNEASFSNQKEIEETMKKLIGLDFDQFTKSMMLAQGEFNKFLKCNENERAAILEKLTGDEIYRKIAIAVHDLYAKAEDAVSQVKSRMGDSQPMAEDDRKKLDDEIAASETKKNVLADTVKRLEKICTWYEALHERETSVQTAVTLQADAVRAKQEFEPNEKKLKSALDAQELESAYGILGEKRKAVEENEKSLGKAVEKLPEEKAALKMASDAKQEKAAAWDAAKKAYADGEKLWERVSALDVQIDGAMKSLGTSKTDLAQKQKELEQIQQNIADTTTEIDKNNGLLETADTYIQQHGRDAEIEAKMPLLNSKNQEFKDEIDKQQKAMGAVETAHNALVDFETSLESKKNDAKAANNYLETHKDDVNLVNVLPQARSFAADIEKHQKEFALLNKNVGEKESSLEDCNKSLESEKERLQAYKDQKEKLVQNDLPVVVLELRERLKDGSECPVCGSKEHPSCDGHEHPVAEGVESLNSLAEGLRTLNDQIDDAQGKVSSLEGKISTAQDDLAELKRKTDAEKLAIEENLNAVNKTLSSWRKSISLVEVPEVLNELDALSAKFMDQKNTADTLGKELKDAELIRTEKVHAETDARNRLDEAQARIKELSVWFTEQLTPWFSSIESDSIDALLVELQNKNSEWQRQEKNKQDYSTTLASLSSRKGELEKSLVDASGRLETAKKVLEEADKFLAGLVQSRKELFGDKVVETERQAARTLQKNAEDESVRAVDAEQKSREAVNATENKIEELQGILGQQKPQLEMLLTEFTASLVAKNFADEQAFAAARLPEAERKFLIEKKDLLEKKLTEADTSVKNAKEQLSTHLEKRDFEETEDVAKVGYDEGKKNLEDFNNVFANLIAARRNDDELRQRYASLQQQLTQLTDKRDRWTQMQKWFNGNNLNNRTGNEFVRFVQVITLRSLLRTANTHLHDMFPRYELTAKDESLDIMLIDHHNSDAIRPISNISGGEGFLVSLSLALGISSLASRNVSIDSMFLDEGFGTLDTHILQDTIVVLQKMQKERGKMLGVITHVDVVKGELPTRIDVVPQGGGRSVLTGAGVSRG